MTQATCERTYTRHCHLSDTSLPCALAVVDIIQRADWLTLLPPDYNSQRPAKTHTQLIIHYSQEVDTDGKRTEDERHGLGRDKTVVLTLNFQTSIM